VSALDIVVGRQPIFDRNREVYGYELLFRNVDGIEPADSELDGDLMTTSVLFASVNIGVDRLVGGRRHVFCNADRGVLTGSVPVTLPADRTVLEILETVQPDEEIIAGIKRLSACGFRMALDDFTWFEGAERLLELVQIVKFDLLLQPLDDLPDLAAKVRKYRVMLLAEKIETEAELQYCLDLGFDLFQGYALGRPRVVPGRTLETSAAGRLRITASLLAKEFEVAELEEILRTEPGMTYQLLRLAGAGANHGMLRKIRSLREALVILGSRRIRSWVALLMLMRDRPVNNDDITTVLTRARMCELLALANMPRLAPLAFTAGMLSALDVLLQSTTEQILSDLPLDEELRTAAFGNSTRVGRLVLDVTDYLTARTALPPARSGLPEQDFHLASIRALMWAVEAVTGMSSNAGEDTPALNGSR
jgi:c-di-GMP-related signal transduction protein